MQTIKKSAERNKVNGAEKIFSFVSTRWNCDYSRAIIFPCRSALLRFHYSDNSQGMSSSVIRPLSLTFLRERSGVSMPELAKRCSVDRSTVYGWASKGRSMRADDLRSVSQALLLNDADELALFRWAAEPREMESPPDPE